MTLFATTRTVIVTVALLVTHMASGVTEAAPRTCLNRSEAKAMYKGAYLYWHRDADGHRCYSNVRRSAKSESVRARHRRLPLSNATGVTTAPPTPAQPAIPPSGTTLVYLPAELMPPPFRPATVPTILDSPLWAWVHDARAAAHEPDIKTAEVEPPAPVYSTFPRGGEPDTWPTLPPPPEPAPTSRLVLFIFAVLSGMALGLVFWRWQLNRLRFPRRRYR